MRLNRAASPHPFPSPEREGWFAEFMLTELLSNGRRNVEDCGEIPAFAGMTESSGELFQPHSCPSPEREGWYAEFMLTELLSDGRRIVEDCGEIPAFAGMTYKGVLG
ncbi:MAG: hypothetical protein ACKVQS_06095 [Fimbriimonadaceae bacterium]